MVGWVYFINTLGSAATDNRDKSFKQAVPSLNPTPSWTELNWDPATHGVAAPPPHQNWWGLVSHIFSSWPPALPTLTLLGCYLQLHMLVSVPDAIITWHTGNKENLADVIGRNIALDFPGLRRGQEGHPHQTQTRSLQVSTWGKVLHVTLLSSPKKVHQLVAQWIPLEFSQQHCLVL